MTHDACRRVEKRKKRVLRLIERGKRIMKNKREFERLCAEHTHCPTCAVDMTIMACHIDFQRVRRDQAAGEADMLVPWEDFSSDPCDDCCCGGCGSRKNYPGEAHC